ncbi:MAG: polysaccharide biosynthesis/export family protein [Flavobacteriaceae bacterium]|nr:polysaccharide biosynthesis/export family protein [Flavobacteriaceae bacterium]
MNTNHIQQEYWYLAFFIISWIISYISFPVIIKISNEKNLLATPTERSSHIKKTPTLGGVGIFIGFILALTMFGTIFKNIHAYHIIGSVVVLFFLGLKDDILILSAKTKFIVQFLVALILILSTNLTINNLFGFLNIYEITESYAIAITLFTFILVINAYNLIDGVDGLAGTIALCFLLFSAAIFYNANQILMCIVALTLMGAIIAFLQYNFSKNNKIFMGDTGSMIVGFLLSFLLINILQIKDIWILNYYYKINPVLVIALMFYPLLDTTRIFFIRIFIYKKSPFVADRNHIHHRLLDLDYKHWQISAFIGLTTLSIATISIAINKINIHNQLLIIIILGTTIFSLPLLVQKIKNMNLNIFKNGTFFLLLLIAAGNLQSCTSKKEILYFQSPAKNSFEGNKIIDQKIETNDIISIRINSLDIESSKIYNIDLLESLSVTGMQPDVMKLKNYLVNNQGEIIIPVLGTVKVSDKTTNELQQFLTKKLIDEGHLKEPTVIVRIINSKITILGEVKNPGTFTFPEKNLTLLQALGLAGDLTINGKRNDIILIRQENNTKTIHHIDVTTKDWMESELYYIKQNDVIVVNPNNAKIKSAGIIGNAATLITAISLVLTGILLLKN